jgi:hypothetical protein
MLDEAQQPIDEFQAARDLSEDLDLTDETAAGITGGGTPLVITKTTDQASPILYQSLVPPPS